MSACQLSLDGHAARARAATPALLLRPYQAEALEAVDQRELAGVTRQLVVLPTGAGKAQPTDEPVLTPSGWRPIGDLAPGDLVVGEHGYATEVLSVHPQGQRPIAHVRFTDGAETRCDWDHLWAVETKTHQFENRSMRRGRTCPRPPRVLTLREIVTEGLRDQNGWRHFIPLSPPSSTTASACRCIPTCLACCSAMAGSRSVARSASTRRMTWQPCCHCPMAST